MFKNWNSYIRLTIVEICLYMLMFICSEITESIKNSPEIELDSTADNLSIKPMLMAKNLISEWKSMIAIKV